MLARHLNYHIYFFVTIFVFKRFYLIKEFLLFINLQVLLFWGSHKAIYHCDKKIPSIL